MSDSPQRPKVVHSPALHSHPEGLSVSDVTERATDRAFLAVASAFCDAAPDTAGHEQCPSCTAYRLLFPDWDADETNRPSNPQAAAPLGIELTKAQTEYEVIVNGIPTGAIDKDMLWIRLRAWEAKQRKHPDHTYVVEVRRRERVTFTTDWFDVTADLAPKNPAR